MLKKIKPYIVSVVIALGVGGLSAALTSQSMDIYSKINQPPLSPPSILFPIVWTILFTLMGIASYLVVTSNAGIKQQGSALKFYALQLIFNFFWSIWFFNLQAYWFAFVWLVALLILIIATTIKFWQISKLAGILLLPYIAWVTFAGYLNLAIALLN